MPNAIPGPTFKMNSGMPCGCHVRRDESKLRWWFCPTHAVAFEMLETLRQNLSVLDDVVNNAPAEQCDVAQAMDAGMRSRKVIRKATTGVWG